MPTFPRIVAFAGATREKSFNKMAVRVAAAGARAAGADVTIIELNEFPMPLYDGDLESQSGIPETARRFKRLLVESDGLLIASPEYNSSISGVLKNAIDWASRPEPGEPPLAAFTGKVAGILAASAGALGGLRGLVHLRSILSNINMLVIPEQHAISRAHEVFDNSGAVKDDKQRAAIEKVGQRLAAIASRLRA